MLSLGVQGIRAGPDMASQTENASNICPEVIPSSGLVRLKMEER